MSTPTFRPCVPELIPNVVLGQCDGKYRTYLLGISQGAFSVTTDAYAARRWPSLHALRTWIDLQPEITLVALVRGEFGVCDIVLDVGVPRPIAFVGGGGRGAERVEAAHAACNVTALGPVS